MALDTVIEIQPIDAEKPRRYATSAEARRMPWSSLYGIGGIAALVAVALIPIQTAIFILWPPPTTVLGYFSIFQTNVLLGLLDLDLLMIVDQLLIILGCARAVCGPETYA